MDQMSFLQGEKTYQDGFSFPFVLLLLRLKRKELAVSGEQNKRNYFFKEFFFLD